MTTQKPTHCPRCILPLTDDVCACQKPGVPFRTLAIGTRFLSWTGLAILTKCAESTCTANDGERIRVAPDVIVRPLPKSIKVTWPAATDLDASDAELHQAAIEQCGENVTQVTQVFSAMRSEIDRQRAALGMD